MQIVNQIDQIMNPPKLPKALRSLKKKEKYIPASTNPIVELKALVGQHKQVTKWRTMLILGAGDRKLKTGEVSLCRLPADTRLEFSGERALDPKGKVGGLAGALGTKLAYIEKAMESELKKVPVYAQWLRGVHGVGVVTCAYLLADIDILKATKPSNLIRFCGLAVINGRLERPTAGAIRPYNLALRTRLFLTFPASMWKLGGKQTNKYLKIWKDKKHGLMSSDRVDRHGVDDVKKWTVAMGTKNVSVAGWAHSASWHTAARVFLEDLYIVWRALEGLPVWPDYHAAKLGYAHGGKICVDAPKALTIEDAIGLVGDVGGHAREVAEAIDEDDANVEDVDLDEEMMTP